MDTSQGLSCQALRIQRQRDRQPGATADGDGTAEGATAGTLAREPPLALPFSLPMQHPLLASLAALAVFGLAFPAAAHTVLVNPAPLTGDDNAKAGPCGCYFGGGPEDPGEDGSPNACPADFPVTTLEAGTELTVEWKETVNHNGDFRIAFSPNAPDQTTKADVDANILMQIADDNATSGATLTQTITVPSEPCELCILQLRQFMINAAQPYYYSCAAVKIVAPGGSTSTGAGGAGGGAGGSGGAPAATSTGQGAAGPAGGGVTSSGAGYADPEPEVGQGCTASSKGTANAGALAILGLAVAAGSLRRLRARRRSG